jgi:F-type H+-transporting ATPase subunit epsilon
MKLDILSPERLLFSGEVSKVVLPGAAGSFEVLKNHASLISVLKSGDVIFFDDVGGEEKTVNIKGGFVEVKENVISVCAE